MVPGRKSFALSIAVVLFLFPGHAGTPAGGPNGDVIGVVEHSGRFTAFLAALRETGLEETLKGQGPFTLFVPTDEAFGKVSRVKLDALLKNKAELKRLLLFHLVAGRLSSPEFLNKRIVRTYNGRGLRAAMKGKSITVENASIITADLPAANGVVHVIDAVLLPPATGGPR